jgi:hypothetical protein
MQATPSNTASAHSPSPQIADSNDGRVVDDAADKRPCPLVFDVFTEDDNRLVRPATIETAAPSFHRLVGTH